MYWDSSWLDSSSKNIFFKKVLLSIDLINIFFLENFFLNFFKKKNFLKKKTFLKSFFFLKIKAFYKKKVKKLKKRFIIFQGPGLLNIILTYFYLFVYIHRVKKIKFF